MNGVRGVLTLAYALLIGACAGNQSALEVHGPTALRLKNLTLGFAWTGVAIWAITMALLVLSLLPTGPDAPQGGQSRLATARRVIRIACCLTVIIVIALITVSFLTTRAMEPAAADALKITVRGEQWWWRVRYGTGQSAFETANEIHIPIRRSIELTLESGDVIHSFWVPSLAGKVDMLPGRINRLTIRADQPGIYRGQCAEFCGLQHAHMAFEVIAQDPADYNAWEAVQRGAAAGPATEQSRAGLTVFRDRACAGCHTIRGVADASANGPDLTHLGSRQTIAAGLLETSRGSLAAWIADPQTLKPGNKMPLVVLSADELRDVSAYLAGLQ